MPTSLTRQLLGDPAPGRTPWAAPAQPDEAALKPRERPMRALAAAVTAEFPRNDETPPLPPPAAVPAGDEPAAEADAANLGHAHPPGVRGVEPICGRLLSARTPATGEPIFERVAPTDLLVDEGYQRGLTERSIRLIQKIVEEWDWRRFKPPVVAMTDRGLEIIDGQHTAIAAATHPVIDMIPVMVVEAPEVQARAAAFIGHNRDRLAVTAIQLHHAAVAARDEDALTVEQVCQRAGVRLLRFTPGDRKFDAGDTLAIVGVKSLIDRRGAKGARETLQVLVQAGRAPISAADIKAAESLLTDGEFADQVTAEDVAEAIRSLGPAAEREAKLFSATHCVPLWQGLRAVWFQRSKKRRKA